MPVDVISASAGNADFECPGTGTYASEKDCVSYFQCTADGTAYRSQCPSGLHFNRETKVCDWPDNVQCQIGTEFLAKACLGSGLFADPDNCQSMYWCVNGRKMVAQCQPNLYFDPYTASCHFYAAYR